MASEEESTSDSVSVRQIPGHLLKCMRSRILHYVAEASEFSAEIHQGADQPARLVFSMGSKPQSKLQIEERYTDDENDSTNVILIQNFPSLLDEEFLELFFESTKKKGGGPVRSVSLNRQKNWALVEFVEPAGVKTVLSKKPITMLDKTLEIQPYSPLIHCDEELKSVDIRGLPKDLTEYLHAMYLESMIDPTAVSDETHQDTVGALKSKDTNKQILSTVKSVRPGRTSASTRVDVKQVPTSLLNYLRTRVLHYLAEVNDFSVEIQQISGQSSQLIILTGTKLAQVQRSVPNVEDDINSTNKILVQSIPSSLDEDMIEAFFESTKKCGGGPVNKLELNTEKNWAIVEFSDTKAVSTVMNNRPIKMLGVTVDVQPYAPLLRGEATLDGVSIKGLPITLTEDVVAAHLENMIAISAAGKNQVTGDVLSARETVTVTVSSTDPIKMKMLEELKFQEQLDQRFPPIKVIFNTNEVEVIFHHYDFFASRLAKLQIYEILEKFDLLVLDSISQNCLDLFQFTQTMDYISNKLKTKKLVCVWEVRAPQLAVCSFSQDISSCVNIITGSVQEKQLPVPTLVDSFSIRSRPWQDKVTAVQAKFKGLCKVGLSDDSSKARVTATDNVVEKIIEDIQTYWEPYTLVKKWLMVPVSALGHLDQIANDLSHHSVQILSDQPGFPDRVLVAFFEVSKVKFIGTTEGLQLLEERLKPFKKN